MSDLVSAGRQVLREATEVSLKLFKIMIPVIILVKLLKELGMVEVLASLLSPFMGLVGVPGGMGLVIATTMLTNIYGGVAAFVLLSAEIPLTVAQATVVTCMMLVAHTLPVELRIAQKAGVRLHVMALIRILGAFVYGGLLNGIYGWGGWLQYPNAISWMPSSVESASLGNWLIGQVKGLAVIYVAILGLLILLRILDRLGATDLMIRSLQPVLRFLGIGREASPLTIIGMTLGIAYGGGLIIQQAKSGEIPKRDIFFSLTLMGLCHSIFEDTFIMALLGGHLSGILWGRVLFSLICVHLLVRWVSRLSEAVFNRYLFQEEDASMGFRRFPCFKHLFQEKE